MIRNLCLIVIVLLSVSACIRNDSFPKGIYINEDEFEKSFKGVKSVIIENYPIEIDNYIDDHLKLQYNNDKFKFIKIVTHPAIKSKITTLDSIIEEKEPYVDSTVFLVRVKVKYGTNNIVKEDNWTYYFDKEAKIEWEMKN